MRKNILFLILFSAFGASAASRTITLPEVVQRVSQENYLVYQNALKVYQAKTNIEKARADLLPRLNIWSIAGMIIDPMSIFDRLTDVAPFLVPANWFRLEQNKLLYLAEKEGYRALWGNEVHTAKTLYKHVLFDETLLAHVKQSAKELERIHTIVKTRETFGGVSPGTARDIEIKLLGLREDQQNLEVLIAQEKDELSYMLAYPANDELSLEPVALPDVEAMEPLQTADYEFRLLSTSPERRQFSHFLSVISQIKKEIEYSFMGVSEISRGVAGGIFDSMPTGNGIGFGNQAATNIVEAQKQILVSQRAGVEETLKRQLRLIGTQYNSDLGNFSGFKRRAELSKQSKDAIIRRLSLGEDVSVVELSEVSRSQIQAETALLSVKYRVNNSLDRLQRLIFDGDYSMNPPLIESLKGVSP